jgi:PEP-CTERM motif
MLPRIRALLLSLPIVIAILGTGFVSLASLAAVGYIPLSDALGLRSHVKLPPVSEIDDTSIDSASLEDAPLTSIAIIAERDARLARLAAQYSLQLLNQPAFPRGSGGAAADGFLADSLRGSGADGTSSSAASAVEEMSAGNQFAGAKGQFGGANGELQDDVPASAARSCASCANAGAPFNSIRRNGDLDLANLGLFQESIGGGGLTSDTSASIFPTVTPQGPETPVPFVPGGGSGNATPPSGDPPKDPPNNPPSDPTDPGDPVDVPEPATMSMLALGVGMMWLSRARRGRGVPHY